MELANEVEPKRDEILKYFVFFGACVVCTLGGFWIGRLTSPKPQASSPNIVEPVITLPPVDNSDADIPSTVIPLINYLPILGGTTYTDKTAKFSFQYNTALTGIFDGHEALGKYAYGKNVSVQTCHTPRGTSTEECQDLYTITVFNNYEGGSRRVWMNNNLPSFPECQKYYQDISVASKNALIVTHGCGSWGGETFVLVPNGKQMLVYNYHGGSRNELLPFAVESLATLKFL